MEKMRMDQTNDHQNLQNLTHQFVTSHFVKKVTQFLLSVSVFSLFLSYSSWYCFILHYFKFHFSSFSSQLLTHTMDKNCIFLIFNGILVFLAKTSGFIRFSPASDQNDQLFKMIGDGEGLQSSSEMKDSLLEREVSVETYTYDPLENFAAKEEEKYFMEGETEEYSNLIVDYKEPKARAGLLVTIGEEEEEDEENGLLSTEELNKKFEDFIRRIKEEIRVGAQQQLVMA